MSTSAEQKKIIQQCEHTHPCEPTIDYLQQNREKKNTNIQTLFKNKFYFVNEI